MEHDLKELLKQSSLMLEKVENWDEKFHDYAFIVFPAAKAYEGFLKQLFLDLGFITQKEFLGKRIRIGKALNPSLYRQEMKKHKRYKKLRVRYSVYDKLVKYCNGDKLAIELWDTWKKCRNLLFHWFPNERNAIDLDEAGERVERIIGAMNLAFKECKI